MAGLTLDLDTTAFEAGTEAILETLNQLAALVAGKHPDAACHLFEAPLSDLMEAMGANNLLAVPLPPRDLCISLGPHPAMVAYGALVDAIRLGLEAGLEADAEAVVP